MRGLKDDDRHERERQGRIRAFRRKELLHFSDTRWSLLSLNVFMRRADIVFSTAQFTLPAAQTVHIKSALMEIIRRCPSPTDRHVYANSVVIQ